MASLSFTLLPEALMQLRDVLICLSKFNETVSIEADPGCLRLSTLNVTKSGYASYKFDARSFFSEYSYSASGNNGKNGKDKISCQIYIKALLSVFKGRAVDFKDKDTAIERCEAQLLDSPDEIECRLIVKMICKHGVLKTYKLTYEPADVQHALFGRSDSQNEWNVDSRFLREILEHFGRGAEHVDVYCEDGRAVFTSFTEKVMAGTEILKQPVHTSVSIETRDFAHFSVEEGLHVAINVRDFRAVILHADTLKVPITARYTRPCRPLQFSYGIPGMTCEITLMTRGEAIDETASAPSQINTTKELSARPAQEFVVNAGADAGLNARLSRREQQQTQVHAQLQPEPQISMPPPASQQQGEKQIISLAPVAPIDHESLFVAADDDRQWDEPRYEEEEKEDMLRWDSNLDQEALRQNLGGTIQDILPKVEGSSGQGNIDASRMEEDSAMGIPPTQRISQYSAY
ncbi:DNA repair protein rad9 [Nannizzia gypsea CBS 118893]|uniref:DNA repair protein rad9 n=1 Tax=Arthroderma gypseum (strain ATCC MYA-4604 / CBS 118893) TaxID=535722 RepID=E5R020_ARTGP|nr:DNA repair protein rad9 [Nannizzia gypsea CBS 118893]EFQ98269.1 DNA repair protein rad9 [Nannizzia gypsea CBS 118893]